MKTNEFETHKLKIREEDEKNANIENLLKSGGKEHRLLVQKVR